jgi:hypothetical protein
MYELKEYLKAINTSKEKLMDSEDEQWEKKYPAYIINKCLAPFQDTIFLVNEMNMNHQTDKKLQFDFLLNTLRTRQRYTPWLKAKKEKHLECVKEYYGYSNEKAKSVLSLLTPDQIEQLKHRIYKGGKRK